MSPRRRLHASPIRDAAPVAPTPHHVRAGLLLSAISLAAIGYATLMPAGQAPVTAPLCIICGDRGGVDAFLNFLLFTPLGAGLWLVGLPRRRAFIVMTLLSASIEVMQVVAIPGRDASFGDLLFNSLGGAAGFTLLAHARVIMHPSARQVARLTAAWCGLWLAVQVTVSYAFSPALPDSHWFLQAGRKLPEHEQFPGSISSVSIGARSLHDGPLAGSASVRSDLLSAAPLAVALRPAGPTRRTAPIIHIVDVERRGILLLAQRGTSLLFTMRTGADRLRVRPPMMELAGALIPATLDGQGGLLTVATRREHDALVMAVNGGGRMREYRVALTTALGWTLVFPTQWRLTNGTAEHLLSFTWFAALLLPFGWWTVRAPQGWKAAAVFAIALGLTVVPRAFGLPVAAPHEWLAAFVGVSLGSALRGAYARHRMRVPAHGESVEHQPHTAAASRQESATA